MKPQKEERARILVVEDQYEIRVLLGYLLETRFHAEVVATFEEAVRRASQQPFDLFLLDINLGEERTGMELIGPLRATPANAGTPAVACTAYAMYGDRERFLRGGFDGYIAKPFTCDELLDAVNAALSGPHGGQKSPLPRATPPSRAAA